MRTDLPNVYIQLNYPQYKDLEEQLTNYHKLESTHRTVEGAYHKSIRVVVLDHFVLEFQGPLVKAPREE